MKSFKELNIKPKETSGFTGDKMKIAKVFNKEIIVHDFKIQKSKFEKGNDKCLYLQIELNNQKYVVFTGSTFLMDTIQQVPKEEFPFTTTIIKEDERFEFT